VNTKFHVDESNWDWSRIMEENETSDLKTEIDRLMKEAEECAQLLENKEMGEWILQWTTSLIAVMRCIDDSNNMMSLNDKIEATRQELEPEMKERFDRLVESWDESYEQPLKDEILSEMILQNCISKCFDMMLTVGNVDESDAYVQLRAERVVNDLRRLFELRLGLPISPLESTTESTEQEEANLGPRDPIPEIDQLLQELKTLDDPDDRT